MGSKPLNSVRRKLLAQTNTVLSKVSDEGLTIGTVTQFAKKLKTTVFRTTSILKRLEKAGRIKITKLANGRVHLILKGNKPITEDQYLDMDTSSMGPILRGILNGKGVGVKVKPTKTKARNMRRKPGAGITPILGEKGVEVDLEETERRVAEALDLNKIHPSGIIYLNATLNGKPEDVALFVRLLKEKV